MEIDVTTYVENADCSQFSDSIANSGLQNIGEITWNNATERVRLAELVTQDQQDELRSWLEEFGAWTADEIDEMSDVETNALLLQFVAGDVQEIAAFETYAEYSEAAEQGTVSGRLYRGDDNSWYFYVGS